ncbi:hypothetical protein FHU10_2048 [Serratia fonticola]|uniref:Uncharacterized protein n=1 Tax=Serratia fonticola TaxID=47917 RepID=A0A542CW36_SERFO|nr:hypothetical protein [Serratia fonticola]TQI77971.1 hypothetical protein FHU09_0403 [Serratia fonticola]TQI95031.1 hypothetical protein FHU11_0389 [Serratia fonticola]TVZ69529.1 hypothetical protein FHU10_2048 [Serratia fonticola]
MHNNNITRVYSHPQDVIHPLAVFLEAVQFLQLDPSAKELAADLIAYAQEMAKSHTLAATNKEADNA